MEVDRRENGGLGAQGNEDTLGTNQRRIHPRRCVPVYPTLPVGWRETGGDEEERGIDLTK